MKNRQLLTFIVFCILASMLIIAAPGRAQETPTPTPSETPEPTSTREFSACKGYMLIDFSSAYPYGLSVDEEGRVQAGLITLTDRESNQPDDLLAYRLNLQRTWLLAKAKFLFEVGSADLIRVIAPLLNRDEVDLSITLQWFGTPCDFLNSQIAAQTYLRDNLSLWELPPND